MNPEIQAVLDGKSEGCVVCGDCLEVMKGMPGKLVCITDPPYGVDLGNHVAAKESRSRWLAKQGYDEFDDSYENWLKVVPVAIEIAVYKFKVVITFCAGTMMWDLPRPSAVGGIYLPAACGRNCWGFASLAHILYYGKCPDLNKGSKHIAIRSTATSENNGHPCPKPLHWMEWLVDLGSRNGDIILDPFCGSGTTCVAAKKLGRRYIGIDISETYCQIARDRLKALETGVPVKERKAGQGGLFDEKTSP